MHADAADVRIADYEPRYLDELITMWRASFEGGVGVVDPHPLVEQRGYFLEMVLPNNTVRLALMGDELVGFVAATHESIAQLYVRVDRQRRGIGRKLLEWAKAQSAGSLWLYTFAQNQRACAFYERHGFQVAARGFEPEWQLEDIKYIWRAAA